MGFYALTSRGCPSRPPASCIEWVLVLEMKGFAALGVFRFLDPCYVDTMCSQLFIHLRPFRCQTVGVALEDFRCLFSFIERQAGFYGFFLRSSLDVVDVDSKLCWRG